LLLQIPQVRGKGSNKRDARGTKVPIVSECARGRKKGKWISGQNKPGNVLREMTKA